MAQQDLEQKRQYFPGHMDSAWDLSSGGMGIHLHGLKHFSKNRDLAQLPKWAKESVTIPNSNFLVTPYMFGWNWQPDTTDPYFKKTGPHAVSPDSEANLKLINQMTDGYHAMKRHQLRLGLAGEEAVQIPDPEAPIGADEFTELLKRGKTRGLVNFDTTEPPKIETPDDDMSLVLNILRVREKPTIEIEKKLYAELDAAKLSERFRERTFQLATYKLGAMLGLTEQLTFDALALGVPYSETYKPQRGSLDIWNENWQRLFEEQMPDLAVLYRSAHVVLVANAQPNDDLVAHLLPLKELPNLAI